MSIEVKVETLKIIEHPTDTVVDIAIVEGKRCAFVKKGEFTTGDLAIFIPVGALLPPWLVNDLNLKSNVVKAEKRGIVNSNGIIYPLVHYPTHKIYNAMVYQGRHNNFIHRVVRNGNDVTDILKIKEAGNHDNN